MFKKTLQHNDFLKCGDTFGVLLGKSDSRKNEPKSSEFSVFENIKLSRCGADQRSLSCGVFSFIQSGVDQVAARMTTKVQVPVCITNFVLGNADVIQGDGRGGMTEDLLEQEQLTGVVVGHEHLMESKGLSQGVGRHMDIQTEVLANTTDDSINGIAVDRNIFVAASIAFTSEHIIAELYARCIFKVQGYGFDDSRVDGNVPITLLLSGILGLLFQNGKGVLEGAVGINNMRESKGKQIADSQTEVYANDEEHIISIPFLANKELGDPVDILDVLDRLCGMLSSDLVVGVFGSGGDEACFQLTTAILNGGDVDGLVFYDLELDDLCHLAISFLRFVLESFR